MGSSTTDWTLVPCIAIARSILNHWTTREVLGVIPPSPPAQENFIFKAEGKELLKMGRTLYWYISLLITVLLFPSYLGQIPQPVKCFICLFVFFIVETNIIVLINYYKCIFYSFLSSFCFRDLKINLTKACFLSNCPQKFTDSAFCSECPLTYRFLSGLAIDFRCEVLSHPYPNEMHVLFQTK